MSPKKIAVLFGGNSPEYAVSLLSAHGVLSHLDPQKYQPVMIGITPQGDWFHYTGSLEEIKEDLWCRPERCTPAVLNLCGDRKGISVLKENHLDSLEVDAVFPVLHGKNGEDGTVQGMFALTGLPVIGCGVLASALCMDKNRAHKLAYSAGISVPLGGVVSKARRHLDLANLPKELAYPLFVKPLGAGSSFGISRVTAPQELASALDQAFQYDSEALIEEEVSGFEVGCAVLGSDHPVVGRVDEIELEADFFNFTEKYSLKTSKIHMPARISPETEAQIRQAALTVYRTLGCSGFARVDFFYTPQGKIVFNEVNTIPGFTAHSRYPNMMRGIGISFSQLLDALISLYI